MAAKMVESQWMVFDLQHKEGNRKTDVVVVYKKDRTAILGTIRWYGVWRCYAFFPNAGCLFNLGCLEDINYQIRTLGEERKLRVGEDG